MSCDLNNLVEVLRAALRRPEAVPQAKLAEVLGVDRPSSVERRPGFARRSMSVRGLQPVRIAG